MEYDMSFAVLSEDDIEVLIVVPSGEACRFASRARARGRSTDRAKRSTQRFGRR